MRKASLLVLFSSVALCGVVGLMTARRARISYTIHLQAHPSASRDLALSTKQVRGEMIRTSR